MNFTSDKALNENNANYNYEILRIQEEDRRRIAGELHDTSLQNLAHLIHQIELSNLYIDKDPIRAKLELSVVNKNLKNIIDEIRNIIFDIRPMTFDDLGLRAALERLVDNICEKHNYKINLEIDEIVCENDLILLTIYRIVQEGFHNIVKHSGADKVFLQCKCVNDICFIRIKDNGKGFEQNLIDKNDNKHFGLSVMKERVNLIGGIIEINSEPDKGTDIKVRIPLL